MAEHLTTKGVMPDEKREQLRSKYFAETFENTTREQLKFGQFGMPATLAAGETHMFKQTKCHKTEDGVVVQPRNIQTKVGGGRKGRGDAVLFSKPSYVFQASFDDSKHEIYRDAGKFALRDGKKPAGAAEHDGKAFRPARHTNPRLYIAEHEHKVEINHIEKNFRDEEGGVAIGPRNFFTMPPKKGNPAMRNAQFQKIVDHVPDDYNAPKALARKELDYHLSKLQDKPFSNKVKLRGNFNHHKDVFFWKGDARLRTPPKRRAPMGEIHDGKNFRPSHPGKNGHNKCLGAFPEYKENPLKFITRKKPVEGEETEEMKPFK